MAQPSWVSIGVAPLVTPFDQSPAHDPVIESKFEDGLYQVLATATDVPDAWVLEYRGVSPTDKATFLTYWKNTANFGATVVAFTNTTPSISTFVHMRKPSFQLDVRSNLWRIQVTLIQALGTYT